MSAVFEPLSPENVKALRLLNSALFPVKFHDQVYKDALMCGDVSQLAYIDGTLVGAIMCRLEAQGGGARLYVVSLGVLAPYRCSGLGTELLNRAIAACSDDDAIATAALHVHAGDDEAQAWYTKRGFSVQERIANYYKRLDPPDALLLVKPLGGGGGGDAETSATAGGGPAAAAGGSGV